jgi:hypothetical protein
MIHVVFMLILLHTIVNILMGAYFRISDGGCGFFTWRYFRSVFGSAE